mgnify:CR=1 FL=1
MISLDEATLKLAEKKNNFSAWVRSALLREQEQRGLGRKKRWRYECPDCEYVYYVSRSEFDPYFYCPKMMKGECDNIRALDGTLASAKGELHDL